MLAPAAPKVKVALVGDKELDSEVDRIVFEEGPVEIGDNVVPIEDPLAAAEEGEVA
jgi:hypothetical protein